MKSAWHKRYTVDNNLNATHNLLAAIVETGARHRTSSTSGTMGVYGYGAAGVKIPEGYLTRADREPTTAATSSRRSSTRRTRAASTT